MSPIFWTNVNPTWVDMPHPAVRGGGYKDFLGHLKAFDPFPILTFVKRKFFLLKASLIDDLFFNKKIYTHYKFKEPSMCVWQCNKREQRHALSG